MSESLALLKLDGWSISIHPSAQAAKDEILKHLSDADFDGEIPQNAMGQSIADGMAQAIAKGKTFIRLVGDYSEEQRRPYFEHAKNIKATTDRFVMEIVTEAARVGKKLGEFEAEKKRVEQELERQRQEEIRRKEAEEREKQRKAELARQQAEHAERMRLDEIERKKLEESNAKLRAELEKQAAAERERQAQAEAERQRQRDAEAQRMATIADSGLRYEAPKTEGVSVKVAYEFEIANERELAEYCWRTGKSWVNKVEFFKRDITAWINSNGADLNIPGLAIRKVAATNVRAERRGPKTIDVKAVSVSL